MPVDKDRGSGNLLRSEYVYYTHTQPYPSSKPLPPVRGEVDSVRGEESREQISWGLAGQVRAAGGGCLLLFQGAIFFRETWA